jgi:hypothetical protein
MARVAGTMNRLNLDESKDRWTLPVEGVSVVACCIDYAMTLRLGNDVSIRIEQPFIYRTPEGVEYLVIPEDDPARMAPALVLCRLAVRRGYAFKDGRLELTFVNGSTVSVPATEDHEPWELVGPGGLRIVSIPGGDLAVWRH